MKKYALVLAVALVLFISASLVSVFSNDIVWDDIGRGNLNLRTVLVNPDNPHIIYIGSSNAVLESEDGGVSWRNILSIRGQKRGANFLLLDPQEKNSLYAATGNGLFASHNKGKTWNRIFKGKNSQETECTTLAVSASGIYLGTKQGLFISKDKGRSFHRETGRIGKSQIRAIAHSLKEPDYIYIACIDGVFKTQDAAKSWERVFVRHPVEDGNDKEEGIEDSDEQVRDSDIRYISIDPNNLNYIYLATSKGVYKSMDRGDTWDLLSDCGLLDRGIEFLLISSNSVLYAAAKSGIFRYEQARWHELSQGVVTQEARSLDLDNQANLYAACDKGLFRMRKVCYSNSIRENIILQYSKDEPQINTVQEAAIHYAEVELEKIKEWRKKAKMKAVLPKLTVGLDNSKNTNYEIYTSATTHYIYEGPYDRSSGWDVTLSWDLGDLIWSNEQTSIDVRSRLMVQLRDDILDEVTKIYFERLRVKMELDNLSIEDRKKRFEKELRLQELTAMLDGLTGGYFSKNIKM